MTREIETLVVSGPLEGTQTGGDGIVRARFHANTIRRICIRKVDLGTSQKPIEVLRLARISAEQEVVA